MLCNIPYEMYVYKNSPYSNLMDDNFQNYLLAILSNQQNISNFSKVFHLLDQLRNNDEINKTIKQIENIFQLKKEFHVYLDMSMNKFGIHDVERYGYYYWSQTDEETIKTFGFIVRFMTISNNEKAMLAMQALEFKNNKYCINLFKLLLILSE
ncbi:hypothetical protein [Mycoplasma sp. 2634B]